MEHLILTSGGHNEAGGLTIRKQDFIVFKEALNKYAKNYPLITQDEKYLDVTLDEITKENYALIKNLSPFGHKFRAPLLRVAPITYVKYLYSRDGKHIITPLESGVKLIGFSLAEESKNALNIGFTATFAESEFRGRRSIDLIIKEFFTA